MQQGGYAAAAKVSHLSVPSIWQHIRALEAAYGVTLFIKHGRQVSPTSAARRLYEQVEPILVQLDSTFETVVNTSANQTLRLVVGSRMMQEDLAIPLARFQKQHSNRLVLLQGNDRRAEELLLSDQADLAAALEPDRRSVSHSIHYEPAYSVEFLAVCKKGHPYSKRRSNSLNELAKYELVATETGTHGRDALDDAFHRQGLTPNIVVETGSSAFTIACVAAGMGVGVLAGRKGGELCKKLATRSLSEHMGQKRIVVMYRKGRVLTSPLQSLVDEIQRIDQS